MSLIELRGANGVSCWNLTWTYFHGLAEDMNRIRTKWDVDRIRNASDYPYGPPDVAGVWVGNDPKAEWLEKSLDRNAFHIPYSGRHKCTVWGFDATIWVPETTSINRDQNLVVLDYDTQAINNLYKDNYLTATK